jgi:hypothetical protein
MVLFNAMMEGWGECACAHTSLAHVKERTLWKVVLIIIPN